MLVELLLALYPPPANLPMLEDNQEYLVCTIDEKCYAVSDGAYLGDGKMGWYIVVKKE